MDFSENQAASHEGHTCAARALHKPDFDPEKHRDDDAKKLPATHKSKATIILTFLSHWLQCSCKS